MATDPAPKIERIEPFKDAESFILENIFCFTNFGFFNSDKNKVLRENKPITMLIIPLETESSRKTTIPRPAERNITIKVSFFFFADKRTVKSTTDKRKGIITGRILESFGRKKEKNGSSAIIKIPANKPPVSVRLTAVKAFPDKR